MKFYVITSETDTPIGVRKHKRGDVVQAIFIHNSRKVLVLPFDGRTLLGNVPADAGEFLERAVPTTSVMWQPDERGEPVKAKRTKKFFSTHKPILAL